MVAQQKTANMAIWADTRLGSLESYRFRAEGVNLNAGILELH
jgi:hypothetical protein